MRKVLFYAIIGIVGILLLSVQSAYMQLSHISGYATTLIHLKAWMQQGFSSLHFSPSYTQGNIGDQFIQFYQGPIDVFGNCYYTSFPPGALWLSYFWIKLWPLEMSLSLGILNTVLYLFSLTGLAIWAIKLLNLKLYPNRTWIVPSSLLLIGLTPLFLFFFSNYYFIENIAFTLSIWSSYLLWSLSQKESFNTRHIISTGIIILILSLCESIGFFYGAVFIFLLRRDQRNWKLWGILLAGSGLLTFSLYSSIDGVFSFIRSSLIRLAGRNGWTSSGLAENGATIWNGSLLKSGLHILQSEASQYLFLGFCAILLYFIARRREEESASYKGVFISVLPILIHLLVFANANLQHHQLIIKSLLVCWPFLLIGFSSKKWIWSFLFIGAAYLSYIQLGYRFNYKQLEEERYVEQFANELKNQAKDQALYIKCSHEQATQLPVLIYYSGRNIGLSSMRGKQANFKFYAVDSFWHSQTKLLHQ